VNSSGLAKLVAVTVVVAVAALVFGDGEKGSAAIEPGTAWLEDLADSVNDVASIEVVAGGERFTIAKDGEQWGLQSWGGFPTEFATVKRTVVGLSELTLVAARTAKAERHADLQLEDPGTDGAASLGVTLRDAGGTVLADVVLGKAKASTGLFVREAGARQTWQVKGTVDVPRTSLGWVSTELLRMAATEFERVDVIGPSGEALTMRDVAGTWELDGMPAERELKAGDPLSRVAGALAYLDLTSVAPADEGAQDRAWRTTRFTGKDGLVVTVQSAADDGAPGGDDATAGAPAGDGWMRLSFDVVPEPAPAQDDATDASEPGSGAPDLAIARAKAKELTERLSPWTFRVSSWKVDALALSLDDVLEPLPEAGPPAPAEPGALEGVATDGADASDAESDGGDDPR